MIVAGCLSPTVPLLARVPDVIDFQGFVQVEGSPFSGSGLFKFALRKGTVTMWVSSFDNNADGEPDQTIALNVTNGLFHVGLGDTAVLNMRPLTDATIPFNDAGTAPVTLRVWFNDGVHGLVRLSPDQPVTSTAFAQEARTVPPASIGASQLANSAVGSNQIASGSINTTKLTPGLLSRLDAADGSPSGVVQVATNGAVTVAGNGFESAFLSGALLTLRGGRVGLSNFTTSGSSILLDDRQGITNLGGADSVAISGNTAFVTARDDNSVLAINITDPASMNVIGSIQNGGAVTSLASPEGIAVAGNFAYVASSSSDTLTILNVANPAAITVASFVKDGVGGVNDLNGASAVAVSGNFAYVAAPTDGAVSIFNVANKSAPTLAFVIKTGVLGLTTFGAYQVTIAGNLLFVGGASRLTIFDISTPTSPVLLFPTTSGNYDATVVKISGSIAYVGMPFGIRILDISDPSAPVSRSTVDLIENANIGGYGIVTVSPSDLALDGNILYVAMNNWSRLYALDVSNPSAPKVINYSSALGGPVESTPISALQGIQGLAVANGRVFVASATSGAFFSPQRTSFTSGISVSMVTDEAVGIGTRNPAAQLHVQGGSAILETSHLTYANSSAPGGSSAAFGEGCISYGFSSFALGQGLETRSSGSTAVGTYNFSTNFLFAVGNGSSASFRQNALTVLANGNIGLNDVPAPAHPIEHSSGARLTAGGTWTSASDVRLKENLKPVAPAEVLEKIRGLPVYEWNYKTEGPAVRHLGPTAQDFRAAFGLGQDDRTIATIDEGGVSLAAIQALIEENRRLRERVDALEKRAGSPNALPAR